MLGVNEMSPFPLANLVGVGLALLTKSVNVLNIILDTLISNLTSFFYRNYSFYIQQSLV